MAKQKIINVRLNERQIDALARSLLSGTPEATPPATGAGFTRNAGEAPRPSPNASMETHLQDAQFIACTMQTLSAKAREQVEQHLQTCDVCAEEMERIQQLSNLWSDQAAIEKLRQRIQSQLHVGVRDRFRNFLTALRVSLKPLILPQAAYGEGNGAESISLEFPVADKGDQAVPGLKGVLTRRNREYYLLVQATNAREKRRFATSEVSVTLSDAPDAAPLLQRNISVGVTTFLGTGLRLTEATELEAHLLPKEDIKETT